MKGWKLELDIKTLFFLRLLLAQAGVPVGGAEGGYIEEAKVTVEKLVITFSDGSVHELVTRKQEKACERSSSES